VDSLKASDGRVYQTQPVIFSGDETCDFGNESARQSGAQEIQR